MSVSGVFCSSTLKHAVLYAFYIEAFSTVCFWLAGHTSSLKKSHFSAYKSLLLWSWFNL